MTEASARTKRRPRARAASGEVADERVGVVFVHGIGFQEPRATLLDWANALLQPVWARGSGALRPVETFGDENVVEVEVSAPARQVWVLTEAFWASAVRAPSFERVANWLAEGVIARGTEGVARRRETRIAASATATGVLLLYSLLRLALGIVPFGGLRDAVIARIDTLLTGWVGDVMVLVDEPIQAAAVRLKLSSALRSLKEDHRCTRLVVVAHSGGAAVAYYTLNQMDATDILPDSLITHGQGLSLVRRVAGASRFWQPSKRSASAGHEMRWIDFWASKDPAPIGPLTEEVAGQPVTSIMVENHQSVGEDHGSYWENLEEFVLPVLDEIGSASREIDFRGDATLQSRRIRDRYRRVGVLATWRKYCSVFPVIAILYSATHWEQPGFMERTGDAFGDRLNWVPFRDPFVAVVGYIRESSASEFGIWVTAVGSAILYAALIGGVVAVVRSLADTGLLGALGNAAVGLFSFWIGFFGLGPPILFLFAGLVDDNPGFPIEVIPPIGLPRWVPFAGGVAIAIATLLAVRLARGRDSAIAILVAVMLAILAFLPVSVLVAVGASPAVGRLFLGALLAVLAFAMLRRIGDWRWRAWDRGSRTRILTGRSMSFSGSALTFIEGGFLFFAGVLMTYSFASIDAIPNLTQPLGVALGLVLVVIFFGLARDAADAAVAVALEPLPPPNSTSAR